MKLSMMAQLLAKRPPIEPIVYEYHLFSCSSASFGQETEQLKRAQVAGSSEVDWKKVSDAKRRVKKPNQRPATTTVR